MYKYKILLENLPKMLTMFDQNYFYFLPYRYMFCFLENLLTNTIE